MERLARLKVRVESLDDLRDLMGAMRALAASQVQEAQAALGGIRRYTEVIEDAIGAGMSLLQVVEPAASTSTSTGRDMLVVICSEHGFVGALNDQLLARAAALMSPGSDLAVVGRRGAELAGEAYPDPVWETPMATHIGGVLRVARTVADRLQGADRAELLYAGYRRGGHYEIESRRVLPLDPALLARGSTRPPPLHHLPATELLLRLADEYLLAELTRALMESFASENGARLRVMEAADRNIDDRLTRLQGEMHALRQESITAELLELITGAAASAGTPDPG